MNTISYQESQGKQIVLSMIKLLSVTSLGIIGACWGMIELASFFIDTKWLSGTGNLGLVMMILVGVIPGIYLAAKQLSQKFHLLSEQLVDTTRQLEEVKVRLDTAAKQDITSALVGEIEQAYSNKRWNEVIWLGSALSRPLWLTGRYAMRITLGEFVEQAAAHARKPEAQAIALIDDLGWTKVALRRFVEAKENILHGIRVAEDAKAFRIVCKGHRHLAGMALKLNELDEVLPQLEKARHCLQHIEDAHLKKEMEASFMYTDGNLDIRRKDYDSALQKLGLAQRMFYDINDKDRAVKCYAAIGRAYFDRGDYSSAKDSYRAGLTISREMSRKDTELRNLVGLANLESAANDYSSATSHYEAACSVAAEIGDDEQRIELEATVKKLKTKTKI